jgi:hypothetical protein
MLPAAHAPALCLETLYAVRPATWLRMFHAYAAPRGLSLPDLSALSAAPDAVSTRDTLASLSPSALESLLVRSALPDLLLGRLATVEAFASDPARVAIYEAQRALAYVRPPRASPLSWRHYVSPADHIAGLLADAASDPAAASVVACASIRVARSFPPRLWYQFIAKDAPSVGEPTQYLDALTRAIAAWAEESDRGPFVRVRAFGDLRKAHFEIAHEDLSSGSAVASSAALALGITRPVRSHLVSYDAPSRRLFVWTAMPELVLDLVAILARVLFGDAGAFFQASAVTLDPLQAQSTDGAHAMAPTGTTFSRMSLIGFTWDSRAGHTLTPRSKSDALSAMRTHGIGIEGGEIRLATLRGETAPGVGGPRTADLALRPPYSATCSEPELATAFLREADALSITQPDAQPRDWWRHWPCSFAKDEWRNLEGGDLLFDRGAIVESDRARRVAHPRHAHAGRIATAYASGMAGKSYALADDPLFPAFLIDDAALAEWKLDWPSVAAAIAKELELVSAPNVSVSKRAVDADGFVSLGARDMAPTRVHFHLCARAPSNASLDLRRKSVAPDMTIFVVPSGRSLPAGFAHVALASLAGPYRPLLEATVRALGIEKLVDPTLYVSPDVRLVVHVATKQIYFDGKRIAKTNAGTFHMISFLAANTGHSVETRDILKAMSPKSDYGANVSRAMRAFEAAIVDAFGGKRKTPKDYAKIFAMDKLGKYRLAVPVLVV